MADGATLESQIGELLDQETRSRPSLSQNSSKTRS